MRKERVQRIGEKKIDEGERKKKNKKSFTH